MRCPGCGLNTPFNKAPEDFRCMACARHLQWETDDYLLHGAGGLVREVRPGQVTLGRLVEEVIKGQEIAIAEGPVGIGKTFSYLIPSLLAEGKRIVVSTAKKQLQHQIARKDAPYLAEKLGKNTQVALLKGKSNYACRVKVVDIKKPEDQAAFVTWLNGSEYGDITDYPGKRPYFWGDVTAEDCIGSKCRFFNKCGYARAKQQTKTAQVIIANHHVVAFDLRFGPRKMLGEYDVLIIDEAHQAPAAFRGAFSQSVGPFAVKRIIRQIDNVGLNTGLERILEDVWERMFQEVAHLDGEVPRDPFGQAGLDAIKLLEDLDKIAKREMAEAGVDVDGGSGDDDEPLSGGAGVDWGHVAKLEMLRKSIERPLDALTQAHDPGDNTVIYVQTTERKNKIVNVAPISVGPMIGPKWQQIPTTVLTSATIAVNGEFSDIKRQLGLDWKPPATPSLPQQPVSMGQAAAADEAQPKKIHEIVLQTPFDYKTQALLYTPKDVPLPVGPASPWDTEEKRKQREAYIRVLTTHCMRLIRSSDGNAFVLFTSNQDLNEVHQRLLEEDLDNTFIPQGDDAEAAFKQFMATPRSVILGNKSFWEGVDVQGDKLRLVIVTKLPFPLVSDPVLQARQRQFTEQLKARGMQEGAIRSQVFNSLQIPAMITDLRQGAGRLIRSKTDKGVLAILDCRVWTGSSSKAPTPATKNYGGYGSQVVGSIGFPNRTSDFVLVDKFLQMLRRQSKPG